MGGCRRGEGRYKGEEEEDRIVGLGGCGRGEGRYKGERRRTGCGIMILLVSSARIGGRGEPSRGTSIFITPPPQHSILYNTYTVISQPLYPIRSSQFQYHPIPSYPTASNIFGLTETVFRKVLLICYLK